METRKRGNYDSGDDFVLEYGELRFTFNERDFSERCEQAAMKLAFVGGRLGNAELEDLVNLAVNGEIPDPSSELGEHVNDCWPELVGPADRSLVHWLRRLVFRSAWLDQRVKEGELDVSFNAHSQSFAYVQPDRGSEPTGLGANQAVFKRLDMVAVRGPAALVASAARLGAVRYAHMDQKIRFMDDKSTPLLYDGDPQPTWSAGFDGRGVRVAIVDSG